MGTTTLNMKGLFVTLSMATLCQYTEFYYAECHTSFIVILSAVYHTATLAKAHLSWRLQTIVLKFGNKVKHNVK